jgi:hypothetical protein
MRSIDVVTTFHAAGYQKYASRMIDTFLQQWPQTVQLHVYAEDCAVTQQAPNLHVHDLHAEVPALVKFKQQWGSDPRARGLVATGPVDRKGKAPGLGFRWDAIRFSHKVYAVCHNAQQTTADIQYWMDADMVCHSPIRHDFIEQQIPPDTGIAFLGRERKFTECGLYALNLRDPITQEFVRQFQLAYDQGTIFDMSEWNDCWVFDRVREQTQIKNPKWKQWNWSQGIIRGEGHPLINTVWGNYLDHLKGARKDTGRSRARDLVVRTQHQYWKSA